MREPPALSVAGTQQASRRRNHLPRQLRAPRPIGTRDAEDWGGDLNLQTRQLRHTAANRDTLVEDWGGLIFNKHFQQTFPTSISNKHFQQAFYGIMSKALAIPGPIDGPRTHKGSIENVAGVLPF